VARGVEVAGAPYVVIVAQSLQPAQDSAADLAALLAAGLPFLLLLVGGLTWLAVGRALRPVEEIRREVEQIEAGELHRSVTPPGTRDEVDRLAHTMNAMLVRLADAEDAQRRFVADASHELRTPLTGIRAQLEVDLAHPERADWPATARGVLEDAIELQQLVGDLLALAELDAGRSVEPFRRPVDLDDVVLSEVARVRSTATVEIDARSVSGAQVLGDEGQLTRVVRNLLDNGVRHAAGRVTVELEERDVAACLRVTNDGPEIPTGDRARVFERFARLDDARGTDSGGTGLGLAIVREIVQRHGGTVEVLDGPGAAFLVTLPLSGERA
jgi:signal transduction histidine kinase